ncbi:MAG: CDP-paratose 2-epimerase [Acidobacteria bacterium]|nr:CDP-paratose 2-epimerase [Acidobacteriota bacterium]
MYDLETEIFLPRRLDEVFAFFADARNLETLTPSFLSFSVITEGEIDMRPGALIDYRLRVRGIPLKWQSEITAWEPPFRFVDEQRRGPYRVWHHEHTFEEVEGGVMARDRVRYDHIGGRLVNRLIVGPDVTRIFDYRQEKLLELFVPE